MMPLVCVFAGSIGTAEMTSLSGERKSPLELSSQPCPFGVDVWAGYEPNCVLYYSSAFSMDFRSWSRCASRARACTPLYATIETDANMPTTTITTSNSTIVNPLCFLMFMNIARGGLIARNGTRIVSVV